MEAVSYPPWYITAILGILCLASIVIAVIAVGAFISVVTSDKESGKEKVGK